MDLTMLFMLVVIGIMLFFMYRSNKKRQAEARKLRDEAVEGTTVMTNFGLYGTIVAVDDDENTVDIESTPGTVVRVHRQTIARVIPEPEPEDTSADTTSDSESVQTEAPEAGNDDVSVDAGNDKAPEFGERSDISGDDSK